MQIDLISFGLMASIVVILIFIGLGALISSAEDDPAAQLEARLAEGKAELEAQRAKQKADWAARPLPSPADYQQILEAEFVSVASPQKKSVLDSMVYGYGSLWARCSLQTPDIGHEVYAKYLKISLEGLRAYFAGWPSAVTTSPFTAHYIPSAEEVERRVRTIANPMKEMLSQYRDFFKYGGPELPPNIRSKDYDGKMDKEYDRDLKEWNKEADAIIDALTPYQRAFMGTPLYGVADKFQVAEMEVPFDIPNEQRFAGTWVIAPSGKGKTNLLHTMIAEDLKERCTIVLMDSKGDLINSYRGRSDVIIIDPKMANINPLQLGSSTRSVEFLEYIFSSLLETSMTALQKTLFRSVLTVLIRVPNATIETFRQILTVGWKPLDIERYILQCDPSTQDFFLTGKPAEFDNATYRETKQQILWRLRLILSNDYLRAIFTSPTTNVQFSELLDSGKTIVIDNSKDALGEEGAEFFGRFFVALTWMAAVSRSRLRPDQKMPVYFYIDECHTVIKRDEKIATILDECRSQKIALILAHQRLAHQIVSPNVLDALANCAIRLANSDDDAASLAPRFRIEASALRLPVGSFACFVRDKTPQAVTISVKKFDLSTLLPPPPQQKPPLSARLQAQLDDDKASWDREFDIDRANEEYGIHPLPAPTASKKPPPTTAPKDDLDFG
jgi:Helicase HerA, central domain